MPKIGQHMPKISHTLAKLGSTNGQKTKMAGLGVPRLPLMPLNAQFKKQI